MRKVDNVSDDTRDVGSDGRENEVNGGQDTCYRQHDQWAESVPAGPSTQRGIAIIPKYVPQNIAVRPKRTCDHLVRPAASDDVAVVP